MKNQFLSAAFVVAIMSSVSGLIATADHAYKEQFTYNDHSQNATTVIDLGNGYKKVYDWDQISRFGSVIVMLGGGLAIVTQDNGWYAAVPLGGCLKLLANIVMANKEFRRGENAHALEHLGFCFPLPSLYILFTQDQLSDRKFIPRLTRLFSVVHPFSEIFLYMRDLLRGKSVINYIHENEHDCAYPREQQGVYV